MSLVLDQRNTRYTYATHATTATIATHATHATHAPTATNASPCISWYMRCPSYFTHPYAPHTGSRRCSRELTYQILMQSKTHALRVILDTYAK